MGEAKALGAWRRLYWPAFLLGTGLMALSTALGLVHEIARRSFPSIMPRPQLRASQYAMDKDYARAIGEYRVGARIMRQPDDLKALAALCKLQGDAQGQAAALQTLVWIMPEAESFFDLGETLSRQGKHAEAIPNYKMALRLKPAYPAACVSLAYALERTGKPEDALAYYREALRIDPNYADAYFGMGNAMAGRGQMAEAVRLLEEAVRLQPDHADAWNNLGAASAQAGDYARAAQCFGQAVQARPADARARTNYGMALEAIGKPGEALDQYAEAVRIDPQNAKARGLLERAQKASPPGPPAPAR